MKHVKLGSMRLQVRKMLVTSLRPVYFSEGVLLWEGLSKRYPLPRHLVSSEAHWTGSGGLFNPAHKVVCGKEEQVVRDITQAARRKCCLELGWVSAAAEAVQNWRT